MHINSPGGAVAGLGANEVGGTSCCEIGLASASSLTAAMRNLAREIPHFLVSASTGASANTKAPHRLCDRVETGQVVMALSRHPRVKRTVRVAEPRSACNGGA